VRIDSKRGAGTTVYIFLPRTQRRQGESAPAPAVFATADFGNADILIVDDDNGVREVTASMLRELGYKVHEAGSGGAALDLLDRVKKIDLMLVDFAMPGMSGADVVRQAHATKPFMPTLYITGFADRAALAGVSESHIIGKPFHQNELAHKVRVALPEAGVGHVAGLSR
jgi:CheY-like chemotaxis protein